LAGAHLGVAEAKTPRGSLRADHEESKEHADHEEPEFDLDTVIADDGKE